MAPDTCGGCDDISNVSWWGRSSTARYCHHDASPSVDGLPGLTDDAIDDIPHERMETLLAVVKPDDAPPWWCPRRML